MPHGKFPIFSVTRTCLFSSLTTGVGRKISHHARVHPFLYSMDTNRSGQAGSLPLILGCDHKSVIVDELVNFVYGPIHNFRRSE